MHVITNDICLPELWQEVLSCNSAPHIWACKIQTDFPLELLELRSSNYWLCLRKPSMLNTMLKIIWRWHEITTTDYSTSYHECSSTTTDALYGLMTRKLDPLCANIAISPPCDHAGSEKCHFACCCQNQKFP